MKLLLLFAIVATFLMGQLQAAALSPTADVCHLPHESGRCLALFYRYGFDASQGKCVEFVYGGCGGNENNFQTQAACEEKCVK